MFVEIYQSEGQICLVRRYFMEEGFVSHNTRVICASGGNFVFMKPIISNKAFVYKDYFYWRLV